MRIKGHALPLSALQSHQSHIMLPALRSVLPVHFYVLWREDTFKIILLLRVIIAQLHHIPWSITSKPAESRHSFILQMMHCHFNHSTDNLILIKCYFSVDLQEPSHFDHFKTEHNCCFITEKWFVHINTYANIQNDGVNIILFLKCLYW